MTSDPKMPHTPALTRRTILTKMFALPMVAALPAALQGCSRGPKCTDTTGLSAEDQKVRSEIAAYEEKAPDPTKRCADCIQFVPGSGCGTCKVVKGPINPEGTCKLFAPKPA